MRGQINDEVEADSISREPQKPAAADGEFEPSTFDRVIAPFTRESFLADFWGKSFVHVPGQAGRFGSILPWEELNSILAEHRLKPPRLRLVRDGKELDSKKYFEMEGELPQLKAASLVNCLAAGATLILDSIQEFAPGVRAVAESCQEVLRTKTVVNLYAGWRTQRGFDLHWDHQDTMILQVSGRKHWKVYRPTRVHPLTRDVEEPPKPTEAPVWDGILEDGDMLYLPRGWWHVAVPLNEPSLHLTVTIMPPAGDDLLLWLMSQMRRFAEVRMTVPYLASAADRKQYVSRMRELILESWSEDVVDQFIAEWESNVPWRSQIRLPFATKECSAPVTMETQVRLVRNRHLTFVKGSGNNLSFHANGVRWNCAADLVPALERLRATASLSVGELCSQLPDPAAAPRLTAFLTALAMGGAVWLESAGVSGS